VIELDKISTKQKESTWDYLERLSLESLQSLSMPSISTGTSFYRAAKEACEYLVENTWESIFGKDIEKHSTTTEVHNDWTELKEISPKLDEMSKELGSIYTKLEGLSLAGVSKQDPEVQSLIKQSQRIRDDKASILKESLSITANMLEKQLEHIEEIESLEQDLLLKGVQSEELKTIRNKALETKKKLSNARTEINERISKTLETLNERKSITTQNIENSAQEYLANTGNGHLVDQSKLLLKADKLIGACNDSYCEVEGILKQALDTSDFEQKEKLCLEANNKLNHFFKIQNAQTKEFLDSKREELGYETKADRSLLESISSTQKILTKEFAAINQSFIDYRELQSSFIQQSGDLLRVSNSIYYGPQAASILSIGLVSGSYSNNILYFLEDLQNLEKMLKKAEFLQPPMSAEEKAKLKKLG